MTEPFAIVLGVTVVTLGAFVAVLFIAADVVADLFNLNRTPKSGARGRVAKGLKRRWQVTPRVRLVKPVPPKPALLKPAPVPEAAEAVPAAPQGVEPAGSTDATEPVQPTASTSEAGVARATEPAASAGAPSDEESRRLAEIERDLARYIAERAQHRPPDEPSEPRPEELAPDAGGEAQRGETKQTEDAEDGGDLAGAGKKTGVGEEVQGADEKAPGEAV